MARAPSPPAECAQCGAEVPPRAHACPECGADERTGWRETSIYDGLDLPETDTELTPPKHHSSNRLAWYWIITLVTVLLIILLSALGLR
ncbi:MAG: zinc ribbon domain-containing protein [Opitutaceae bacterium]|nr:zinc ribbon domain-containing protein [Opitutaceae bacterium]